MKVVYMLIMKKLFLEELIQISILVIYQMYLSFILL